MTKTEVKEMLALLQIPFAYGHFAEGEAPVLPYIVFRYPDSNNFGADNKVYEKLENLDIELYTDKKDVALELRVETLLDTYELFYNKHESYIPEEAMYEVLYELEAVIVG